MNGKPEEINNDWYHDQTQYSGHKVFTNLKLKKRKTYYIKYAVRKALLWILIQQTMTKFDLWFPFALRQWVFQQGNNKGCPWLITRKAPPNNNVKILENVAIKAARYKLKTSLQVYIFCFLLCESWFWVTDSWGIKYWELSLYNVWLQFV